ncbi:MAG: GMC family oxidoreductase N-terminal domain-containing protein [Microcoleaceae cyanobacterium]
MIVSNPGLITDLPNPLTCEIAVVGSGPGGAITACLLAEAGRDVLLIEEGIYWPLESCTPFSQAEMVQKYRNGGLTAALGKPKIQYVEGKCVGGGSEINSALYHRTPPEILDRWQREFEVEGLTQDDLSLHFEACEQAVTVCPLPGEAPPASLKLKVGADRLGWQSMEVPRWFQYNGDMNTAGTPMGKRQSMTETFIPRALASGCKLLTQTRINRILRQGKKWILRGNISEFNSAFNSEFNSAFNSKFSSKSETVNRPIQIEAETLFVCCGAIQTPALLSRSSITQNIGNTLQMHPTVKVIAQFHEVINALDMGVPVHQVKEFAPQMSFGCSISSPPYLAVGMTDYPEYAAEVPQNWQKMSTYYAMIVGEGAGSVRNLPFYRDPLVRYRLTQNDLKTLSNGLQKLSTLLFEAGATHLYPSITGGQRFTQISDLEQIPEMLLPDRTNLMTVHVFSSCPMGEYQRKCAVNSFGKVHGLDQLYISDASLLCTAPGVNPQGTIMAIARRNVLKFLEDVGI